MSAEGRDLLRRMLKVRSEERISVGGCLGHPYFSSMPENTPHTLPSPKLKVKIEILEDMIPDDTSITNEVPLMNDIKFKSSLTNCDHMNNP